MNIFVSVCASKVFSLLIFAAMANAEAVRTEYSEPAINQVPRQVFWGDTHLHTRLSADAYGLGTVLQSPADAYRLARGETLTAQNGMKVKLRDPLDFLVVTDHAEYLGMAAGMADGNDQVLNTEFAMRMEDKAGALQGVAYFIMSEFIKGITDNDFVDVPRNVRQSIWKTVGETADRFNHPGRFTALIGYEFTSTPKHNNLHRNVIFRDDAETTGKVLPFSAFDSINPEDLWAYMADYEEMTGGQVLAIPHNANLSGGLMYERTKFDGEPITAGYAERRARWEPLYEVTQIKGDSESHPFLSPNDEFSNYETWNSWFGGTDLPEGMTKGEFISTLPGSYARSALKRGLEAEEEVGVNPYKFGMIGSTDSHTSLATAEEDNFFGKFTYSYPSPNRWQKSKPPLRLRHRVGTEKSGFDEFNELAGPVQVGMNWSQAASGLAAVWAEENSREALFDAMKRKEVYATTGSRIVVRFFAGWNFPADADERPDYVDIGYEGGVPMGGDLASAEQGKSPKFLIVAVKDPNGANLDRIQIVKGWIDEDGKGQEKVFDVAWSGDRKRDPKTGKIPTAGSTVNLKSATMTNTIGAALLSTTWVDPEFNPSERAFYYARVIEIPKPRWTTYDAAVFKTELPPDFVPKMTQERAYTSPIWYTP